MPTGSGHDKLSGDDFSDAELLAFLDEALASGRSAVLENRLRDDPALRQRLIKLRGQDTAGLHTIGAIWRRNRLSCPDRDTLTLYMQGALPSAHGQYIDFHLRDIGCRRCQANLEDLAAQAHGLSEHRSRRRRLFQTSAGYLRES